ncbi:hypothetical protein GF380_05880 [Candidatus Uhrbacteria bacterium]|nr:hypothetical protein [Candidatus Uhrbacteria bacterium]MBD3284520.1 hypothetical protein [Candidatus Uhrbacteria bacterium]
MPREAMPLPRQDAEPRRKQERPRLRSVDSTDQPRDLIELDPDQIEQLETGTEALKNKEAATALLDSGVIEQNTQLATEAKSYVNHARELFKMLKAPYKGAHEIINSLRKHETDLEEAIQEIQERPAMLRNLPEAEREAEHLSLAAKEVRDALAAIRKLYQVFEQERMEDKATEADQIDAQLEYMEDLSQQADLRRQLAKNELDATERTDWTHTLQMRADALEGKITDLQTGTAAEQRDALNKAKAEAAKTMLRDIRRTLSALAEADAREIRSTTPAEVESQDWIEQKRSQEYPQIRMRPDYEYTVESLEQTIADLAQDVETFEDLLSELEVDHSEDAEHQRQALRAGIEDAKKTIAFLRKRRGKRVESLEGGLSPTMARIHNIKANINAIRNKIQDHSFNTPVAFGVQRSLTDFQEMESDLQQRMQALLLNPDQTSNDKYEIRVIGAVQNQLKQIQQELNDYLESLPPETQRMAPTEPEDLLDSTPGDATQMERTKTIDTSTADLQETLEEDTRTGTTLEETTIDEVTQSPELLAIPHSYEETKQQISELHTFADSIHSHLEDRATEMRGGEIEDHLQYLRTRSKELDERLDQIWTQDVESDEDKKELAAIADAKHLIQDLSHDLKQIQQGQDLQGVERQKTAERYQELNALKLKALEGVTDEIVDMLESKGIDDPETYLSTQGASGTIGRSLGALFGQKHPKFNKGEIDEGIVADIEKAERDYLKRLHPEANKKELDALMQSSPLFKLRGKNIYHVWKVLHQAMDNAEDRSVATRGYPSEGEGAAKAAARKTAEAGQERQRIEDRAEAAEYRERHGKTAQPTAAELEEEYLQGAIPEELEPMENPKEYKLGGHVEQIAQGMGEMAETYGLKSRPEAERAKQRNLADTQTAEQIREAKDAGIRNANSIFKKLSDPIVTDQILFFPSEFLAQMTAVKQAQESKDKARIEAETEKLRQMNTELVDIGITIPGVKKLLNPETKTRKKKKARATTSKKAAS